MHYALKKLRATCGMTTAEQTEAPQNYPLSKFTFCQQTHQNYGRRLRGILFVLWFLWFLNHCFFVCFVFFVVKNLYILWFDKISCSFVSIRGSINK